MTVSVVAMAMVAMVVVAMAVDDMCILVYLTIIVLIKLHDHKPLFELL